MASLALTGCDDQGNPFLVTSGTGGDLVITVSGGVTPTYAWDGARARTLSVTGGGEVLWRIESLDGVGFGSPVQHGLTPAGAQVVSAAQILEAGVVYTISITTVGGVQASRTFSPAATTS